MLKNELRFTVIIRSGKRTKPTIKTTWLEGDIKKSMYIFEKKWSQGTIGKLISRVIADMTKNTFLGDLHEELEHYEAEQGHEDKNG